MTPNPTVLATSSPIDRKEFRNALGSFATGVTIVTTSLDGVDVGLTANSFNSVSLDPPMVLWSLGKSSLSLPHFTGAAHFAVHILSEDQEALSGRFARRGEDKFAGVQAQRGHGSVPLLEGCVARFQCRKVFEYEGGDHVIFVGEVLAFDHVEKPPLLFHGGKYAVTAPRAQPISTTLDGAPDSLSYLVTRAFFALRAPALRHAEDHGVAWADRLLMGVLLDQNGRCFSEINELISYSGVQATKESVEKLIDSNLVTRMENDGQQTLWLSEQGRQYCLSMIARTKAAEAETEIQLGPQAAVLKSLLQRVVGATNSNDPRMDSHLKAIGRNIEAFRDGEHTTHAST